MPLNPSHGNMYTFVTHTYNTIKGKCPHGCSYCSIKASADKYRKPQRDTWFDKKELKVDLGTGNFIFWGSSCDTFANAIPEDWILESLAYLRKYENKYLLQTKNPKRMIGLCNYFPKDVVLGTTIETNRLFPQMGNAPSPLLRAFAMSELHQMGFKTMVTIEPIMKFDLEPLTKFIVECHPAWVNIGADSKKSDLPEPTADEMVKLISNLTAKNITVKIKTNANRILSQ